MAHCMFIGVGVLCHISYSAVSYLYVNFSGLVTSVWGKRELYFLLSFTCNLVTVVSAPWGFLFL